MNTATKVDPAAILKNNLDHTLFSWSKQGGLNPINAERAEGVYLWDRDGKRYLDFSSQLMSVNIGHGNQKITDAVVKQMKELSFVAPNMATKVRGDLGKILSDMAPGNMSKTFFTLGGSEAIENAMKLARLYTGRHKIITQYRSYHGATMGAITAGGDPRKLQVDSQQMPNVIHIENPYAYRCPWGTNTPEECSEMAARNLRQIIEYEGPETIAAIMMEGESGSSGCIKYPPGYWKKVAEIAKEHGILTIDDEVMSGFGRTGKMFAIQHHGVEPDMICMAKGLTSSYLPLGGLMVSDEISKTFDDKMLPLGLTYSAHAVSCAAAIANLGVLQDENLVANAAKMGAYIEKQVEKMKDKHPSIGDFRNTGLLGCIELVKNRKTKEPTTPFNAAAKDMEASNKMAAKVRELGMFTFVRWNYIFIAPPLIINEAQIDEGLDIISEVVSIADTYCK